MCASVLQDLIPSAPKRTGDRAKESLQELFANPLGRRYLLSLLFLWLVHGYVFYGISHHTYGRALESQVYVCVTDSASKLLGLLLCRWTLQRRAVIAALLLLSALTCFGLAFVEPEMEEAVSALAQACSFLITGSWNILWLFSVEVIGNGARLEHMCARDVMLNH